MSATETQPVGAGSEPKAPEEGGKSGWGASGDGAPARERQFVLLTIGEETYGIEIGAIHGIIMPQAITAVPKSPTYVKGVINLRGKVLPVVDMRTRFGLPNGDASAARHVRFVVVDVDALTVALIVDSVSEVARIAPGDIEPPTLLLESEVLDCIGGVGKLRAASGGVRLVMLLNVGALLGHGLGMPGDA